MGLKQEGGREMRNTACFFLCKFRKSNKIIVLQFALFVLVNGEKRHVLGNFMQTLLPVQRLDICWNSPVILHLKIRSVMPVKLAV